MNFAPGPAVRSRDGDLVGEARALGRMYRYLVDGLRLSWENAPYSVTEGWVIVELAQRDVTEVMELRRRIGMDPGYLSRVLARFQADRLITRARSPENRRFQTVRLTRRGRAAFEAIEDRMAEALRVRLSAFPESDRRRIAEAMTSISGAVERALGGRCAL
ncbi:MarR family winged helix-turn-helix transcriptional regulator [Actinomadura sp. NPDC048394]|jgi:DNA-binding MarR family transcriptional regulator|uniref:MarR family winged helix-turn-helix transcriptional regulator n=1 Tax=Actinomadura sp. NPDC048394 TaxID=3158223 RepID=UPI0033E59F07